MKPNTNRALPCAIFGHNYRRSKTNLDHTIELTCTHCDMVEITDQSGNFDSITVSNAKIKDALQELYRLRRHIPNSKASY